MKRSTRRFLTHAYRQPAAARGADPDDVRQGGRRARRRAALKARIRDAVQAVGQEAGRGGHRTSSMNGEMSKPSYATYIKDRLNGFGGTSQPLVYQDLVAFPDLARRVFGDPGRSRRKTPGCNAAVSVRDAAAAVADAENLAAALKAVTVEEGFISAASPGVVSLFFHNTHYPSHEAYLFAIADAMRDEYESVAKAGFVAAARLPGPRHGPAHPVRASQHRDFRQQARLHI